MVSTDIGSLLTTADKEPMILPMSETAANPAYAAAIAEIDREIDELQRAKAILLRRSGAGDRVESTGGTVHAHPLAGDPLAAVREQEFSGLSPAKATRAFLLKIGRHERTPVIIAAIAKGGVPVGGKNPIATHYTTLKRHSAFVSLGKNYWDLAERRPDLVRAKAEKSEQKKKKSENKRKPRRAKVGKKDGEKPTEGGG